MPSRRSFALRPAHSHDNVRAARDPPPGQRSGISQDSGSDDSEDQHDREGDEIENSPCGGAHGEQRSGTGSASEPNASMGKGSWKCQLYQGITEYTTNRNGKKSKSSE